MRSGIVDARLEAIAGPPVIDTADGAWHPAPQGDFTVYWVGDATEPGAIWQTFGGENTRRVLRHASGDMQVGVLPGHASNFPMPVGVQVVGASFRGATDSHVVAVGGQPVVWAEGSDPNPDAGEYIYSSPQTLAFVVYDSWHADLRRVSAWLARRYQVPLV